MHGQVLTNTKRCLLRNFSTKCEIKSFSCKNRDTFMYKVFRYQKLSETSKVSPANFFGCVVNFFIPSRVHTNFRARQMGSVDFELLFVFCWHSVFCEIAIQLLFFFRPPFSKFGKRIILSTGSFFSVNFANLLIMPICFC